jgi:hypothetical protein
MISEDRIELFVMKCAVAETELRKTLAQFSVTDLNKHSLQRKDELEAYIKQFGIQIHQNAALYYEIFLYARERYSHFDC